MITLLQCFPGINSFLRISKVEIKEKHEKEILIFTSNSCKHQVEAKEKFLSTKSEGDN